MTDSPIETLFGLRDRTVLISGATGHLGGAMAEVLAAAGARVVVSSRERERAVEAAARLPAVSGGEHGAVEMDLFDEQSLRRGFAEAAAFSGGIDILVNNAQQTHPLDVSSVTAEAFDNDLRNVTGYFVLARLLRDHVVSRRVAGSVVMIGSMYGVVGSYPDAYEGVCPASPVQYHAAKGGIVQMTRHLAVYWAKDNVRVNCLSPGPFPAPDAPQEMVQRLKTKSPMGRMGKPPELKGALLLLASDAGSYITGQNLLVDGGWTAW